MTNDQFASHLFRGLGRAYLYLQHQDSSPYHETLLHACLYNPVYDRQFEGSRARYLAKLIQLTNNQTFFEQRILDAFSVPDEDMDVEQLCDFACIYAQAGNLQARRLLYEQFATHAGDGHDTGATQLIDLDGIDGFRFVARCLGQAARLDPDFWDSNHLLTHLKEHDPKITDADIAELGATDSFVQYYLNIVAKNIGDQEQGSKQRQQRLSQPYAQLKAQIRTRKKQPSRFYLKQWGRLANDEDIQAAAHDLLKHDDPVLLASYLAIFTQRQFPFGIELLLPFVQHTNDRVASWAVDALSLFRDPRLLNIGLEMLRDNRHISNALYLFHLNYQVGDENMFVMLLDADQTDDTVHAIGFGLVEILQQNTVHRSFEILCSLYERLPCSLCRTNVVRLLVTMKTIPEWMVHECEYDAEQDTRTLIQEYQAVSQSD